MNSLYIHLDLPTSSIRFNAEQSRMQTGIRNATQFLTGYLHQKLSRSKIARLEEAAGTGDVDTIMALLGVSCHSDFDYPEFLGECLIYSEQERKDIESLFILSVASEIYAKLVPSEDNLKAPAAVAKPLVREMLTA